MAMRTLAFGEDLKGYKVVKKLVEEDAGAIYLAVDQVGTRLRLRMLSDVLLAEPFLRMRALEDLAKLQALKHAGVARFCAWHDGDPAFYAVVDPGGAPLSEVVSEGRALNEKELGWLGVRVAEALAALHKAGIPCGELTPANVTLTATGPVITDLGWTPRMKSSTARAMMSKDITGLGDLLRYAAEADSGKLRVPGRGATALAGEVAERLARSLEGALDGAAAARAMSDTATDLGLLDPPEPDIEALLQLVEKPTELRPSQLGRLFGEPEPAPAAAAPAAETEAKAGDAPTTAVEAKDAALAAETKPPAQEPPKEEVKDPPKDKDAAPKDPPKEKDAPKKTSGVAAALGTSPKDSGAAYPPGPAVSAPPPGRGPRTPPRPSARPSSSAATPALPRPPAPPPPPVVEQAGAGRVALVAGLLGLVGLAIGFSLGKSASAGSTEAAQVEAEVRRHLDASQTDQAKMRLLKAKSDSIRLDPELALLVAAQSELTASTAKVKEAEQRGQQTAEAAAEQVRAAARKDAEGHAGEGKAAQQRGEVEAAREAYLRALKADSQNAVALAGLEELFRAAAAREPAPVTPPPEGGDPNALETWRRQQIEAALQSAQAALQKGEPDQAEGGFRLVKALDPEHPDALRGLAEVARVRDEAHQREAARSADELVGKAQRALNDGRPGVAPMLDALEALDRALQLAPSHAAARLERERLVTKLLASFEERAETDQLTGEGTGDPWLDVIELDRVVIDRGLGGGVRFDPTRVFRPLRERMRAESDGRYRAIIRVRSQVAPPRSGTPGAPPEVLVSGLEIALEDKVAKTCTPWEKLDLPGGPHYRTVRVDGRGRILAPFYSAHGMDVKGVVKRVEASFDRLVQAAKTKAQ